MIGLKKSIETNTMNKRKKHFVNANKAVTWEHTVFGVGARRRIKLKINARRINNGRN